jgi:tRNA pseudouridine32 synthase / 23S rRNA pseudouridine746 synthase
MQSKFEKHIEINDQKKSAVDILSAETDLSKQAIKQTMQKGAVWLTRGQSTKRIRRAKKILQEDDELHIYYDEGVLSQQPAEPCLISDEGEYSVWHKPYGMYSQGSKWGDHCTINRWVENNLQPQRPAFIVHRLDRAANGLILLAHKKSMAARLSKMFKDREIEKRYRVVVQGHFYETTKTINTDVDDKSACSHFNLIEYDEMNDRSLLEVLIDSGRKHQIRVHLSSIGFPVIGDRLYGEASEDDDLQLTAYKLRFICPVDATEKEFILE